MHLNTQRNNIRFLSGTATYVVGRSYNLISHQYMVWPFKLCVLHSVHEEIVVDYQGRKVRGRNGGGVEEEMEDVEDGNHTTNLHHEVV